MQVPDLVGQGRLRPDAIVNIPGQKKLVIDAKVSLNAYQDAFGAVEEREKALHLAAHAAAMKAHVMFLASDAMKGRDAGSPEYDIAAQYVAAQYYAAGLRPAGDNGSYLQSVPLLSFRPADKGTLTVTRGEDGRWRSQAQEAEYGADMRLASETLVPGQTDWAAAVAGAPAGMAGAGAPGAASSSSSGAGSGMPS